MHMREIKTELLTKTVKGLFLKASYEISGDLMGELECCLKKEKSPAGRAVLEQIVENNRIAKDEQVAICQDTGMAVLFVELGQEVNVTGGDFTEAINQGVREAYEEGYLRKSLVSDPVFDRKNTGDNTPAVVHLKIVSGDRISILAMPKGFGSENMSRLYMLTAAHGSEGIKRVIVETVREAGANPCPPVIVGVGVGGTVEAAAQTAKHALTRPIGVHNQDIRYAKLEEETLAELNGLGIGPAGLGGTVTALAVNIDWMPAHIASMPVAINICCHASRHAQAEI